MWTTSESSSWSPLPDLNDVGTMGIPMSDDSVSFSEDGAEDAPAEAAAVDAAPAEAPAEETPEDVAAAAKRSRDAGFNVISAGCGVPIGTPDDNIRALVKAIKG